MPCVGSKQARDGKFMARPKAELVLSDAERETLVRWSVLPQLKMEFVSGRLGNSLTGDSTHEFQPPSLHT